MKNSIVIVTYNGIPWLEKCLDSCKFYDVVVVDNASTDETVSFIEANYPNFTIIKLEKNNGFGAANNIGIRYCLNRGAENIFLLNQDAYLVEDVMLKMVDFQIQNPKYGILSPIHVTGNREKLDYNFSHFMLREKSGQFYSDFVLGNSIKDVYDVPFVNAAAWLVSKSCFEKVGGFDPLFFHYGEDDNYCQRVLFHNLKIGVLPNCYVIHDREHRKKKKPEVFSKAYYEQVEHRSKVKFANINSINSIGDKIRFLKRGVLKALIKCNFKNTKGLNNELLLLKKLRPKIEKSRKKNKEIGSHYL